MTHHQIAGRLAGNIPWAADLRDLVVSSLGPGAHAADTAEVVLWRLGALLDELDSRPAAPAPSAARTALSSVRRRQQAGV